MDCLSMLLTREVGRNTVPVNSGVEAVGKGRANNLQKNDLRIWRLSDDLGPRDHLGTPIWILFYWLGLFLQPR